MKKIIGTLNITILLLLSSLSQASTRLELEGGLVWQTFNAVQIPKGDATYFRLDAYEKGPVFNYRVYGTYSFGNSELRGLYAPLAIKTTQRLVSGVRFHGKEFSEGLDTTFFYKFNSYRLTWRYKVLENQTLKIFLGFTGKVRDAEISLLQYETEARRTDLGFVPLLHSSLDYQINVMHSLGLDADFLGSPYGRAEDIALYWRQKWNESYASKLILRSVEGGSNGGGGVYSFAWFNFANLSMEYTF